MVYTQTQYDHQSISRYSSFKTVTEPQSRQLMQVSEVRWLLKLPSDSESLQLSFNTTVTVCRPRVHCFELKTIQCSRLLLALQHGQLGGSVYSYTVHHLARVH